jgi:RNA polymerase sigma-70 factor, ECF subfamily
LPAHQGQSLVGTSAQEVSMVLIASTDAIELSLSGSTNRELLSRKDLSRCQLEKLTDANLVDLARSGNDRAAEVLVRRYQKLVYNVLYQMLRSHESAADTTQETFLKAFRSLSSFRAGSSLKPWLLKIATNTGLNYIRSQRGREHDSLEALLDENPVAEPASNLDVALEVEWHLSQNMLNEALAKLPPRHRYVFALRYQQDLSYQEIAAIMDVPETTIKPLLFRIKESLRKMLAEKMGSSCYEGGGRYE